MRATLKSIEPVAHNIITFWFEPEGPVHYTAGQFTELWLPHKNPDKRGVKHWFTLSSSPSEKYLSITTKFAAENGSTFKQTLRGLKLGSKVSLASPMGDFVLPKDKAIPLVFIAGGIGATPFRSMVKWLTDTHEQRDIQMIYAANSLKEVAFRNIFEKYIDKFMVVPKEAPSGWQSESGTLDGQKILSLSGEAQNKLYYLSGPEPMVEALGNSLKQQGVSKKQLVSDFFPGYAGI